MSTIDLVNFENILSRNPEYHRHEKGLSIKGFFHPISITQREAIHMYNFIVSHNLKNGYECATGTGISALVAGLAFKENGGKLATLDAYIEQNYKLSNVYRDKQEVYTDSIPYQTINKMLERYGLENTVTLKQGWSPDAVPDLGLANIDFVHIDAGHWDEAVQRDLQVIKPYLADKYAIFIHDTHCFSGDTERFCQELFGKSWQVLFGFEDSWCMGLIDNT